MTTPRAAALGSQVRVPGGTCTTGSDEHYPEEAPRRRATVQPFLMDAYAVTNADFAAFVADTGHRTLAERELDPAGFPGADPALLQPGSLVFHPPAGPVHLDVPTWWAWVPGASWRAPEGPGSSVDGREDHPVVHVAWQDATAFAAWAGKQLPTEQEWEFAARGGLPDQEYAWGAELAPGGVHLANTWQGAFPHEDLALDGYAGTAPVGSYPANPYGLYDLIGNVWEWTSSRYAERRSGTCCGAGAGAPDVEAPRRVMKGGSWLCAPSYCARYRPAARIGQAEDTGTVHGGFRCVVRDGGVGQAPRQVPVAPGAHG